jgi:predicted DNA-binding transcriptional regulator YafY
MAKTEGDFFHSAQQIRLFTLDRFLRRPGGATREHISEAVRAQNMGRRSAVHGGRKAGNKYDRATFRRDLDALENMGANIREEWHFDAGVGGQACFYRYADPTWTMGQVKLKGEDLMAIVVARDVAKKYWGLPIAEDLTRIINQLAKDMPNIVSVQTDQMAPIAFGLDGRAKNEAGPKVWQAVLAATTKRQKLRITYAKRWEKTPGDHSSPASRVVHPYHVVNLCGTWYLIGFDPAKASVPFKQYRMDGILEAAVLQQAFEMPPDFKIDDLLDITFGRYIGSPEDTVDVRLRFTKKVTPLIWGREFQWGRSMKTLGDGRGELTLRVSQSGPWPLYHILGWVLSFGADVEVLEPESLRQDVRKAAIEAAAQYSKTTEEG